MRAGFTLLETLIGLVIASMIALVVLDSLSAIAAQAGRLAEEGRRQSARILALIPVQRALEEAVPDYHDAPGVFEGDERLVRGLTMAPAAGRSGLPAPFELRIETRAGRAVMVYLEQGEALFETPLTGDPRFAYRAASGELHAAWPPDDGGLGNDDPLYYRPLPSVIVVVSGDSVLFAAAPARTTSLVVRSQDFELVL